MIDQEKASQLARAGFDLWQAGQLEESSAKYREALKCADPEHYALEDYHGEFAAVLATLGRDTEARQQYELALAKAERAEPAADNPGVSVARYFLGEHLLKMNEPATALKIVCAVADRPSRQDWLTGMVEAKALWNLGRRDESRAAAGNAVDRAPNAQKRQDVREHLAHILNPAG
jgi:tetratricopeptide (TPR) repeat protein